MIYRGFISVCVCEWLYVVLIPCICMCLCVYIYIYIHLVNWWWWIYYAFLLIQGWLQMLHHGHHDVCHGSQVETCDPWLGCEDSTLWIDVRERFAKLKTFLVRCPESRWLMDDSSAECGNNRFWLILIRKTTFKQNLHDFWLSICLYVYLCFHLSR